MLWSQDKNNLTGFQPRNLPLIPADLLQQAVTPYRPREPIPSAPYFSPLAGLQYEDGFDVTEPYLQEPHGLHLDHRLATRKQHAEPL